jgi:predicted homoserine dehydrogenase-like protein
MVERARLRVGLIGAGVMGLTHATAVRWAPMSMPTT